jgi:hypothetical protein
MSQLELPQSIVNRIAKEATDTEPVILSKEYKKGLQQTSGLFAMMISST